jgi:cytoskeletal protein CcmA (bactofilin family)
MATRMQQRKGTAAQWISTNSGQGPVLNAGEIGFEIDTNKFKIGDGVNHWVDLNYFIDGEGALAEITALIDGAPAALNTLNELAAAINDDPAFFTTIATNLSSHEADTTNVHGIADTSILVTTTGTQTLTNKTITSPSGLVKADVGLGNVNNTSDADKPVSTATQTALDLKANAADITELSQDAVNTAIVAGVGLDKTYDDVANTITIDIDSTVATKAYADNAALTAVDNIVAGAPALLNTLDELAAAMGDDPAYLGTIAANLSTLNTDFGDHELATTNVHGIADTALLATKSYADTAESDAIATADAAADSKISTHNSDTTDVHGIANTELLATKEYADDAVIAEALITASNLSDHNAETANVHGIADTSALATNEDLDDAIGAHNGNTLDVHGIADTSLLATQDFVATAVGNAAVDQSSLAGEGLAWDDENDQFTINSTVATKEFAAELLVNSTKTNILITGDENGLTITAENGVADSTTDNLSEGTNNLYFNNERAQDAVGNEVGTGLSYNDATGSVSVNTTVIQARVADVSDTEIGYLNGVTALIQTQLDAKSTDLATHSNSTTNVHGIADTSLLATEEYADDTATTIVTDAINALDTGDIEEGTNLYYTAARAQDEAKAMMSAGDNEVVTDNLSVSTNDFNVGADAKDLRTDDDYTNPIAVFSTAANDYAQVVIKNTSDSTNSSSDIIAYSSNGVDSAGYINMGITSPSFADPDFTITGGNDGYIFMEAPAGTTGDGNLVLATGNNGVHNHIVFAAGGLSSDNTQMTIFPDERVHIEIDTPSTSSTTGALTVVGGVGIQGDVNIEGDLDVDGQVDLSGVDVLPIGPGAKAFADTLTNPTVVAVTSHNDYAQIAHQNTNSGANASTDVIMYPNNGADDAGYINMGITSSGFNDPDFTITGPNDGYIFMVAPDSTTGNGDLVLATGDTGSRNAIVFAAGGLSSNNEQMVIIPDENVHIEIDTPSTSPSTGALTVVGGVGIQGDLNIEGSVNIEGTIVFGGAGTTVETSNLSVTDPLIFVGDGNSSDIVDLGLVGEYTVGSDIKYAGIVRDASDGVVKVFKNASTKPTSSVNFTEAGLAYSDMQVAGITASSLTVGDVSNTEFGYLNGVTSAIQTQIDGKLSTSSASTTYAPIADPTFTGTVSGVTKAHVGLGNVDNTSDVSKPVSSATQTALDLKANLNAPTFTGTVTVENGAVLGTPASATLTNASGLPVSTGISGLGTGIATALGVNAGSSGAPVINGGSLGTPSGGTLTNATGLPIATGISGLGTGVATFLATPSSANLATMITDEIGTGNIVLSEIATSAQTGSYTLVAADRGKLVEMNVGSANTLTVPLDSSVNFPVGTQIDILQVGSGKTTIQGATVDVVVNATPGRAIRAQWGGATLIKRAANTWVLIGDLTTA